jgi:putative transposase
MTLFRDKYRIESTRIPGYDYSQPVAYFVTICTKNRVQLFGNIVDGIMILNSTGSMIKNEWEKTGVLRKNVIIDEFVVMPNHFHGIIIINDVETPRWDVSKNNETTQRVVSTNNDKNISTWDVSKNNETTQRVVSTPVIKPGSLGAIIGQFKSITTKKFNLDYKKQNNSLWQPRYYEHIIRDDFDMNKIREYIVNNPLNWDKDEENII